MSEFRGSSRLLVGIGLVLVGLLSGILVMMVLDDEPAAPSTARIVTRVDDDRATPVQRRRDADSGAYRESVAPASLSERFRAVAETVTSAVVSIRVQPDDGQGPIPHHQFEGPRRGENLGSGVVISPDGYVVTNNHVVKRAGSIRVRLADKRQFDGRLIGTDASTDLAVVKIQGDDLPSLSFGNSNRVQVGDWVVAVGSPFNLTSTVTAGIVSALDRQLGIIEDQFRIESFIQTDAAINPGNSGGALVDLDGDLIGINTAIASGTGGYEGYGFAIPSVLVERIATDLIAYGEVRRGYLGVSIDEVDAEVAADVGLDAIHGVYVVDVRGGSAADRAGLESGDVVESIDGKSVNSPGSLQSVVALHRPGDVVTVDVWRDGSERSVDVRLMGADTPVYQSWLSDLRSRQSSDSLNSDPRPTPGPRPDSTDAPVLEIGAWGIGLGTVGDRERERFGIDSGAYVAYVESGGPADEAGVPRDVVITALDETKIEDPMDVQAYLTAAEETVLVQVERSDGTQAFYEIDAAE